MVKWNDTKYEALELAEIIDGTWGKTAQPVVGISVTARFTDGGQSLTVTATTTTKASPRDRRDACTRACDQLDGVITSWISSVKKQYKERVKASLVAKMTTDGESDAIIRPLGRSDVLCDYLIQRVIKFNLG